MSGEWEYRPLGELITEVIDRRGITPLKLGGTFSSYGHRVISAKSVKNNRIDLAADESRYISDELYERWMRSPLLSDDVLLTSEAPLGELAYLSCDVDWCLGQRLFALRTDKHMLYGRYLFYSLQFESVAHDLQARATGTTVVGIRQTELLKVEIPLPPLPEQRRIAKILGDIDDKIELNRKMNETLEQMARALFKSWFVDFDPVRAKMEGRTPTGMDAATAALFPNRLVDSELGPIPEGWEVKALGEIVECVGGGTPSTRESRYWENGNINWATPKDLASIDAPVLVDTERRITDVGLAKVSSGLLPAGTLLMSSRAPVGYLAISTIDVAINQGFISMLSSDSMSSHYMLQWCTSNLEEIRNRASGTTFAEISKASFRQMSLVLPPSDLMRCYTKAAVRYYDKITSNIHQSRTLSTLRDTLLPKLVSGEVRV